MDNNLANVHPELVCEWSDRNLPLTPDMVTYGSNKLMWWKAACGHEWQTSVKARSKGEKCPICSGARVAEGINDLATLKPVMVTVGSSKKIIWKGNPGEMYGGNAESAAMNGSQSFTQE